MKNNSEFSPELRARIQDAVRNEEVPPFLEARVRAQLTSAVNARAAAWYRRWAPAGAAAMLLIGAGVAYQVGHLRFTVASQESYITSAGTRVATIMRVGLSDHLHCAYFRKFPKTPPPMDEFVQKMGPDYAALIPVVQQNVPATARVELAHKCRYRGRQFVHLVVKDGSTLTSLVVAKKSEGESFETEGLLPALVQSGLPVYHSAVHGFDVASFESRDHLIYLISNQGREANRGQLLAMASGVRAVLGKIEL